MSAYKTRVGYLQKDDIIELKVKSDRMKFSWKGALSLSLATALPLNFTTNNKRYFMIKLSGQTNGITEFVVEIY